MENKPEMHAIREFWKGVGYFWAQFWRRATNQGMLVMTLFAAIIGLILWVDNRNAEIVHQRLEFKQEIAELRTEYRKDIAYLKGVIDSLKAGLEDCQTARYKAEAQNATLLELIKSRKIIR